jgi:hypothetical protein
MKPVAVDDFGARPSRHDLPVPEPATARCWSACGRFGERVRRVYGRRVPDGVMEHCFSAVLGTDFARTVEAAGPGVPCAAWS